jgi:hypothetical protein
MYLSESVNGYWTIECMLGSVFGFRQTISDESYSRRFVKLEEMEDFESLLMVLQDSVASHGLRNSWHRLS